MALLFVDGFDHYATADITKKWSVNNGSVISSSAGRRSGGAWQSSGSSSVQKNLTNNEVTLIVGAAWQQSFLPGSGWIDFLVFSDSGTVQTSIAIGSDGSLRAWRSGSATLGTSANAIITSGSFYYIETKITFSDASGVVVVKVNGVQVLNLTSVDTKATANAYANQILLSRPFSASGTMTVDDLYVCNDSGSTNNDFLGDCRVDTLLPNGDGNYTSFTPSTGTTHYLLVDESTPNTTDYNESSTATNKDSYQMVNLGALASQTIYGVQVLGAVLKDDAGARSIKVGVRSSSTDSVSAAQAVTTSQFYYNNIHETNPATAVAWTESGVNAAEALFEVA